MKKLIFAATVMVCAFSYTTSLQAQTNTQNTKATKATTKTATQNSGATTPGRAPAWRAGAGCYSGPAKMSGRNC
jgi:hypothetical protein